MDTTTEPEVVETPHSKVMYLFVIIVVALVVVLLGKFIMNRTAPQVPPSPSDLVTPTPTPKNNFGS